MRGWRRASPAMPRTASTRSPSGSLRSVPHFLPSFHEQAGRAFLDAGALAQAAASFGRAREAERAYGLKVDEAQRRQAFLEVRPSPAR